MKAEPLTIETLIESFAAPPSIEEYPSIVPRVTRSFPSPASRKTDPFEPILSTKTESAPASAVIVTLPTTEPN